jgi:hypothetical protein
MSYLAPTRAIDAQSQLKAGINFTSVEEIATWVQAEVHQVVLALSWPGWEVLLA